MYEIVKYDEKTGGKSSCRFYKPPEVLGRYIRYYWMQVMDGPHPQNKIYQACGTRFPRLIFHHLTEGSPVKKIGEGDLPMSWIGGPATKSGLFSIYGRYVHTAISFQPGGITRFFWVGANELSDDHVDLKNFCIGDLNDRIFNAKTELERIKTLNRFFAERLIQNSGRDMGLVQEVLNNNFCPTEHGVHVLSKKMKISERQLERKFNIHVGVSPRKYLKILRFEAAQKSLIAKDFGSLAQVAYELNYSDQSHFIREFKTLSNTTPLQFVNSRFQSGEEAAVIKASGFRNYIQLK